MDNQKVLASVGSREITEGDMQRFLRSFDPQTAAQFRTPDGRKRLLEELINQELLYLDAVENKLDKDDEFVEQMEIAKVDLVKQYAINKLLADMKISEDEMLTYYNQNALKYRSAESVMASHILVNSLEHAEQALREINNGLTFEEAAQKYSTCPSSENGGDLGYFTRGRMVPEFENAAFDMEKGEISKPVKTQFGYHLIKLVDRKEEGARSFDDVKDQIMQELLGQKQQETYYSKVDQLKSSYPVKINE